MPKNNSDIAAIFFEIADILDTQEVEWKPRAYRQAARSIEGLNKDVSDIYKKGGIKALEEIPGIGEGLGKKIIEYIEKGKIKEFENLKKKIPDDLEVLIKIPGMGPKKAKKLHDKLGVKTVSQLEKAAKEHKILDIPGFGEKSEKDILDSIKLSRLSKGKMQYRKAKSIARRVIAYMEKLDSISKIEYAGSLRRKKPLVRDIDILVASKSAKKVMDHFVEFPDIKKVISKGETKSQAVLKNGTQVDIRVFPPKQWGAGLLYFTGSKDHNIMLRKKAIRKGYKLSEYGLFDKKGNVIASKTEKNILNALGMDYVPPENREL